MMLTSLAVSNFRSYAQRHFEFHPRLTFIVGDNASGKTSILEAVHLLSTGKSFRATKIDEMIRFEQELGRVVVTIGDGEESETLEVMLTRGLVQGKRTPPTLFSLNGAPKRKKDVVGNLLSVAFRPEDMRLIEGSPSRRRQFLDAPLSLTSSSYAQSLKTYEEALKKRNRLLTQIREGEMSREVLKYWDLQLIKHGQIIQELRRQFIYFFHDVAFDVPFSLEYDWSEISPARLAQYDRAEVAAGHTLVGPHKDDIHVKMSNPVVDVAIYGSRGQQRLAVLWLKLGESLYVKEQAEQLPVILLDDILSELDEDHRHLVLKLFQDNQVVLTTAEPFHIAEVTAIQPDLAMVRLDSPVELR